MPAKRTKTRPIRIRIGRVSLYEHHGTWWIYYRQNASPQRRRLGSDLAAARQVAATINADLERGAATLFDFRPITVAELVTAWLDYHEHVARSSLATVKRYRAAVAHLLGFLGNSANAVHAHQVDTLAFAKYLRSTQVSPNGHRRELERRLQTQALQFAREHGLMPSCDEIVRQLNDATALLKGRTGVELRFE